MRTTQYPQRFYWGIFRRWYLRTSARAIWLMDRWCFGANLVECAAVKRKRRMTGMTMASVDQTLLEKRTTGFREDSQDIDISIKSWKFAII